MLQWSRRQLVWRFFSGCGVIKMEVVSFGIGGGGTASTGRDVNGKIVVTMTVTVG